MRCTVFVSGGTGYVGRALTSELLARGHVVRALVRPGSERKLAPGCEIVRGDALDATAFASALQRGDTFVHLVGTPHPAPWKGEQFRAVDLVSLKASVDAARLAGAGHFVYVSVAHPAPVMHAYIAVRTECEQYLREAGIPATVLRPWYVLGPGHRWPLALIPVYALLERLPSTRESARRLGLVTLRQMVAALTAAVERPADGWRVVDVPAIRVSGTFAATAAAV